MLRVKFGRGAYYRSATMHTIVRATQWNQDAISFDSTDMHHGTFWREWYTSLIVF